MPTSSRGCTSKNWALDGRIGVVQVREGKHLEMAVENVATRRHFYRRTRPADGSEIDDIEWTLGQIESNATPLLQSFEEGWPYSGDDKLKLAVLFAFQLLRTPRWQDEYTERTRQLADQYRRENPSALTDEELEEQLAYLVSDTHRLGKMLSHGTTGAARIRFYALDAYRGRPAAYCDFGSPSRSLDRGGEPQSRSGRDHPDRHP